MAENIKNETKRSLVRFEASRIFNSEWPGGNDEKVVQALERQFRFAGGFHTDMELIDLDTPSNIRLNTEKVLDFLRIKRPITSVEKFVIPNVGILTSSDQVRDIVETFCDALGHGSPNNYNPVTVKALTLPCDEVSNEFHSENVDWIDQFCSHYGVKRVDITVSHSNRYVDS